jgi:hypothetical protein
MSTAKRIQPTRLQCGRVLPISIRKLHGMSSMPSLKPGCSTRLAACWGIYAGEHLVGEIYNREVSLFDDNGILRPHRLCGSMSEAKALARSLRYPVLSAWPRESVHAGAPTQRIAS